MGIFLSLLQTNETPTLPQEVRVGNQDKWDKTEEHPKNAAKNRNWCRRGPEVAKRVKRVIVLALLRLLWPQDGNIPIEHGKGCTRVSC